MELAVLVYNMLSLSTAFNFESIKYKWDGVLKFIFQIRFVYADTWMIVCMEKKINREFQGIFPQCSGILEITTVNKFICEHRLISHFI